MRCPSSQIFEVFFSVFFFLQKCMYSENGIHQIFGGYFCTKKKKNNNNNNDNNTLRSLELPQ